MENKLSVVKAVTASTDDGINLPGNVIDGNNSTYFSASSNGGNGMKNHWLQIEFDEVVTVVEVRLRIADERKASGDFRRMAVEVGNTDLSTITNRTLLPM